MNEDQPKPVPMLSLAEVSRFARMSTPTAQRRLEKASIAADAVVYFGRTHVPVFLAARLPSILREIAPDIRPETFTSADFR